MYVKKTLIGLSTGLAMSILIAGPALAASNPAGTGQPGTPIVSCGAVTTAGDATQEPNGFLTSSFLNTATQVYAGSPVTPSLQNGNTKAVSQYDIACYQYTTGH